MRRIVHLFKWRVSGHREDELPGDVVACYMGAVFRRVVEIAFFGLVLGGDGVN